MPNARIQVDAVAGKLSLSLLLLCLLTYHITALTRLVTASISEDDYGVVQKHVPAVLQSFSSLINALEKYVANPPIHWTDTEAKEKAPVLKEPEMLLKALKNGVKEIAVAFKPYAKDMELSADMRSRILEAKEGSLV